MPTFPTTETNVLQLANNVVAGLTMHGADFPNVSQLDLETAIADFEGAANSCQLARAAAKGLTVSKDEKYQALSALLKKSLAQATIDNPTKLDEIGWSLPSPRTPLAAPGMATNLASSFQGDGEISLKWDKPTTGGKVATYILQSQVYAEGQWSNWQMVNFFYDHEVTITGQPTGVKINYRVIASNDAGQSNPSNTITVVL